MTLRHTARPLMYIMNNNGPKILPWGTLERTGWGVDNAWLLPTCCVLPVKYIALKPLPQLFTVNAMTVKFTKLSKAFFMSK